MRVDVAIIGGSLAGAACAVELARLGIEAVVFDRSPFPREKVCGGFLSPGAVTLLERLDVMTTLRQAGGADIHATCIRLGDAELRLPFPRPGFGISRAVLDAALAARAGVVTASVTGVTRSTNGFLLDVDGTPLQAGIVIDASGKLSRYSPRRRGGHFGVQFYAPQQECAKARAVLDFWFFADGYGGMVSVEGGRTNASFVVERRALPRYLGKPGCRTTGPLAYGASWGDLLAVGDAAGMIEPFCGAGIQHALDTGMMAAATVAAGVRRAPSYARFRAWSYDEMRQRYQLARAARWAARRGFAAVLRRALSYRRAAGAGLRRMPEDLIGRTLERFWNC